MAMSEQLQEERRDFPRVLLSLPIMISPDVSGETVNVSEGGICFSLDKPLPPSLIPLSVLLTYEGKEISAECEIVWQKFFGIEGQHRYGGRFINLSQETTSHLQEIIRKEISSIYRIPRFGKNDYEESSVRARRQWLSKITHWELEHVGSYSEQPQKMKGNIEHLIGVCQIPLGIAGPIRVNGEYAKGDFFVPLATTEGALVKTYHRGMRVVSEAGGVNVRILNDEVHISPAFFVRDMLEGEHFIKWAKDNFDFIKQEAEKTTRHGKLNKIEPFIVGRIVILKFCYYTQDAQGLNMINKATDAACKFISIKTGKEHIVRSDLSAIKKISTMNVHKGQGKSVFADVIIPRRIVKLLQVTPESICKYQDVWKQAVTLSGIVGGNNVHVANLLAAVFIACGQDVADLAMSHVGILKYEITEGGALYVCLSIPNLMVGTVGGGTGLGTQKDCLNVMACYGEGKAKKFAEILTAAALAGDLACFSSLVNGSYVEAHELYGRNKSK